MKKSGYTVVFISVIIIGAVIFFAANPAGRWIWNKWFYAVQKVDDVTNYETRKAVEDTCRAMMASYTADALAYEQYDDSDKGERQSWADQVKMRANRTAATYNEYILKNSYVFDGNVPKDIDAELEYIK